MAIDPKDKTYEFDIDFDMMKVIPTHIGRLHFEDGSSIRLYFGPKGLIALIRKVKDSKLIIIENDFGETELAGLTPKQGEKE